MTLRTYVCQFYHLDRNISIIFVCAFHVSKSALPRSQYPRTHDRRPLDPQAPLSNHKHRGGRTAQPSSSCPLPQMGVEPCHRLELPLCTRRSIHKTMWRSCAGLHRGRSKASTALITVRQSGNNRWVHTCEVPVSLAYSVQVTGGIAPITCLARVTVPVLGWSGPVAKRQLRGNVSVSG